MLRGHGILWRNPAFNLLANCERIHTHKFNGVVLSCFAGEPE